MKRRHIPSPPSIERAQEKILFAQKIAALSNTIISKIIIEGGAIEQIELVHQEYSMSPDVTESCSSSTNLSKREPKVS